MKSLFIMLTTILFFQAVASAHEPAFSTITVSTDDDKQIDKKDSHQDDKDKKLLIVSLPDLPAGTYKVHWHVVCTDTHTTQGDFKFTLKPKE
jgi:copper resistance protein C